MIARSGFDELHLILDRTTGLTVREELEGNDVDETLQAVDGLWDSDDLGRLRNRIIVLVTDDDCVVSLRLDDMMCVHVLGCPFRAQTCASADWTLGYRESRVMMKMTGMFSSMSASGPCLSSPARI